MPAPPPAPVRRVPRLSISWLLGLALPSLVFLAVAAVLLIALRDGRVYTMTALRDRAGAMLDTLTAELRHQLDPVEAHLAAVARDVASGAVDADDDEALYAYVSGLVAGLPQAAAIVLARPDRRMSLFAPDEGRVERTRMRTPDRIRDWVEQARELHHARWIEPLWASRLNRTAIALLQPLHGPHGYVGVLLAPVPIDGLSHLTETMSRSIGQTPFVLVGQDRVLLHPRTVEPPNGETPLPTIDQVGDPVLARLRAPEGQMLRPAETPPDTEGRRIRVEGASVILLTRELVRYGDAPWLVGSHFPEIEISGAERQRLIGLALAGAAILAVSVLISILFGQWLRRPIVRFAGFARTIQQGDLAPPALGGSPVREFDLAAGAFNAMAAGLRERQRLRDLFGRYVPPAVIETAMLDDRMLGLEGRKREVTALFTDIEGFTALSERIEPDRVVALLNAYFEGICPIIVAHGGIIVDFVGDAVFAVFGAPIALPDHAARALAAAREAARFADRFAAERRDAGDAFGRTRFGIHTGTAIVGNIGSQDRLKYGVAGDMVNTASRLEGANKQLLTTILASAATVAAAGDPDVRPVGPLRLKGRAAPVEAFEVLETGSSAEPWHAAYCAAFARLATDRAAAVAGFARLAGSRPDDRVVAALARRAAYATDGAIIELTEK